jgi:hypothetical protein
MHVRVDSGLYAGYKVPPYYDSMIAKLIVYGTTRERCIMRLKRALEEFVVEGMKTTVPLHQRLVRDPNSWPAITRLSGWNAGSKRTPNRAMDDYPLTPLEQLPLTIDHDAIESAYMPFLLDGRDGERAWKSDYARRRRRALLRMVKRILGLKQRDKQAIQSEYHKAWSAGHGKYDVSTGPQKPAAWRWRDRKLALDGLAAARLRAPLLAAVIDRLEPKKVLEVGCGNGINLFSLAGDFPDVEFTGIDLTPAGIDAAKSVQAEDKMPAALAEYIPLPNPDPTAFKRINFIREAPPNCRSPTVSSTSFILYLQSSRWSAFATRPWLKSPASAGATC